MVGVRGQQEDRYFVGRLRKDPVGAWLFGNAAQFPLASN